MRCLSVEVPLLPNSRSGRITGSTEMCWMDLNRPWPQLQGRLDKRVIWAGCAPGLCFLFLLSLLREHWREECDKLGPHKLAAGPPTEVSFSEDVEVHTPRLEHLIILRSNLESNFHCPSLPWAGFGTLSVPMPFGLLKLGLSLSWAELGLSLSSRIGKLCVYYMVKSS